MKTLYKTATLLALLGGLAFAAQAQTVIGSWQGTSAEGWVNDSGVSITNAAVYPGKYEFMSGVVSGYAQSLSLHDTGWQCPSQDQFTKHPRRDCGVHQ